MVSVIGAGKWGQALYGAVRDAGIDAVITSRTKKDISGFVSLDMALKASHIICTIPTQSTALWLKQHYKDTGAKYLIASKGIETQNLRFLDEIYKSLIPDERLAFLSGPTFATEVSSRLPCAMVINSKSEQTAKEFAKIFPVYMRTYISDDVRGAEICGAYKNVIAIASGICDGLGLGNNARASLIARGLVEMARFGKYFGAKDETFLGLSGAGDLFLTASSTLSRNYRVGLGLAKSKTLDEILKELGEVAEGVATARAITIIGSKHNIYTPIACAVVSILDGEDAMASARRLISRD